MKIKKKGMARSAFVGLVVALSAFAPQSAIPGVVDFQKLEKLEKEASPPSEQVVPFLGLKVMGIKVTGRSGARLISNLPGRPLEVHLMVAPFREIPSVRDIVLFAPTVGEASALAQDLRAGKIRALWLNVSPSDVNTAEVKALEY